MRKTTLFWVAAGVVLAPAVVAHAQVTSHAPAAPAAGTVDSRDVVSANRENDATYNQLAGRGAKITDKDRENARSKKRVSASPATAADIKAGAQVRDVKGVPLGTIATLGADETVSQPDQAVIDTGQVKIGVPLIAFGKDDKGLLLSISAEKFNQLVAQVQATKPAAAPQTN